MGNSNLFNKKKEVAVTEPKKTGFSFKANGKDKTTSPEPAKVPETVDDEVATLLGEATPQSVEEITPEKAFNSIIDWEEDKAASKGEIQSQLEAPIEFAHEDQPETYDNTVLGKIKESLALVKDNINDEQIVGDAIYNLMQQMKEEPALADMLEPEDYGIMSRGLRESYHIVVTVKETKAKSKTKSALKVDEVTALLGEIQV